MTRQGSLYRQLLHSKAAAASAAVHAGAAVTVCAQPAAWGWALAGVLVNHGVLTAAGLLPRSRLLGPNWNRLPAASAARGEVAITVDDGPDPLVTPGVLDLLALHQVSATFFCIGERVERHPELAREILRRGHAIENHSQTHRHDFSLLGPKRMRREIEGAQTRIGTATGSTPCFFRAPAGLRNPFLEPVLADLGLTLASWTRRGFDTVSTDPGRVYGRLANSLHAGDILLLHDGHAARTPAGQPVIAAVLPRIVRTLHAQGLKAITLRTASG